MDWKEALESLGIPRIEDPEEWARLLKANPGSAHIVIGEPSDDCPLCPAFGAAPSRN